MRRLFSPGRFVMISIASRRTYRSTGTPPPAGLDGRNRRPILPSERPGQDAGKLARHLRWNGLSSGWCRGPDCGCLRWWCGSGQRGAPAARLVLGVRGRTTLTVTSHHRSLGRSGRLSGGGGGGERAGRVDRRAATLRFAGWLPHVCDAQVGPRTCRVRHQDA